MISFANPSPDDPDDRRSREQSVIDFWNALSCESDAGETTWGVLEGLQSQVTECLSRSVIDLAKAESLTALAALLMSGRKRI